MVGQMQAPDVLVTGGLPAAAGIGVAPALVLVALDGVRLDPGADVGDRLLGVAAVARREGLPLALGGVGRLRVGDALDPGRDPVRLEQVGDPRLEGDRERVLHHRRLVGAVGRRTVVEPDPVRGGRWRWPGRSARPGRRPDPPRRPRAGWSWRSPTPRRRRPGSRSPRSRRWRHPPPGRSSRRWTRRDDGRSGRRRTRRPERRRSRALDRSGHAWGCQRIRWPARRSERRRHADRLARQPDPETEDERRRRRAARSRRAVRGSSGRAGRRPGRGRGRARARPRRGRRPSPARRRRRGRARRRPGRSRSSRGG